MLNALIGSFFIVGAGTLIGTPIGVLAGTYLAEYGRYSRFAQITRFLNDILLSAPSIIIGLFVLQLICIKNRAFFRVGWSIRISFIAYSYRGTHYGQYVITCTK